MTKNNKYIIGTIIGIFLFLKWKQNKKTEILPIQQTNNGNDYGNDYRKKFVNLIKQYLFNLLNISVLNFFLFL